jgi:hypothetical protein
MRHHPSGRLPSASLLTQDLAPLQKNAKAVPLFLTLSAACFLVAFKKSKRFRSAVTWYVDAPWQALNRLARRPSGPKAPSKKLPGSGAHAAGANRGPVASTSKVR